MVTGFEPLDLLEGILHDGRANWKKAATKSRTNTRAQSGGKGIARRRRRSRKYSRSARGSGAGLGEIPASGFQLRGRFQKYDANRRFPFDGEPAQESPECISGLILQGTQEAARVPGFRREVHAGKSAGRPHGIVRRRVRGLLSLWQTPKSIAFNLSCPVPRVADDRIVLAHGGGGRLTHQLIEKIFIPAFSNAALEQRHDGAVVSVNGSRLAFTTDSFVVRPLIFPGGNIGDLAVNGTVNDLAMCGARPLYLSAGFILEEGLEMETLRTVVDLDASKPPRKRM